MRRGDAPVLAGLSALWLALFLYIDPRGEFPLNDDFQYAEAVRRWSAGGGFHLSQWGLSTSVTHLVLGRLSALLFSPTNWHLRLVMLCVGLAGVLLFYLFLRDLGLERASAAAGAGVLAVNPVYLTMSASFHLDVTATVLLIAAAWAFTAAVRKNSLPLLAASSALVGLGFLTRQTALFSLLGGLLVLRRRKQLSLDNAAALLVPAGVAAAGFWLYLHSLPSLPWAWRTQIPGGTAPSLLKTLSASLFTLGFFLIPLSFHQIAEKDWDRDGRAAVSGMALVGALFLADRYAGGAMPALGNTVTERGLGVVTLTAAGGKAAGLWGSPSFWGVLNGLNLASVLGAALYLFGRSRPTQRIEARSSVLLFGLPPYLSTLLFSLNFDRYLLAALPFLIAAVLLQRRQPVRAWVVAAWCVPLAVLSCAGLRDYFAWNQARWEAGQYLVALGVPPGKIENGFDWDGQYTFERDMAKLLSEKPASKIGMWDWMKENQVVAITSFSDKSPKEGFKPLEKFPYSSPLAPRGAFVHLYGDERAFTPRR